jgi:hypothetical protein
MALFIAIEASRPQSGESRVTDLSGNLGIEEIMN